jgi:hypothetical protein
MKKLVLIAILFALVSLSEKSGIRAAGQRFLALYFPQINSIFGEPISATDLDLQAAADTKIATAYANGESNIQVQDSGRVDRMLPDDREGSPHQRFILELASGQSVLVAHNLALAPRIRDLLIFS